MSLTRSREGLLIFTFENDGTGTPILNERIRIQSKAAVERFSVVKAAYQGDTESLQVDFVRVTKPKAEVITTPADNEEWRVPAGR